ncbi:MAG: DUF58 domain-containing protein [Halobacteriovoraceae bacterium]|nr:DUF58 domain-containing protein [Halobacteriovoraceae bacterium]
MNIKEVHKTVSKIKASLFKNSNSYSIGMLKSHFRGSGLQFKEHQIYSHGDDVRFIDWKLLAKTGTPYIKTFEEERNIDIVVIIDASISMFSGSNNISKLQASIEICCLLYLLSGETKDYIQTLIICDEIISIPRNRGEAGITELIAQLEKNGLLTSKGKLNIAYEHQKKMSQENNICLLKRNLAKKKEIVILSDFNDFININELNKISLQRNIHCFRIISPLDEAQNIPYSFFSRRQTKFQKGFYQRRNVKKTINLKYNYNKKITVIRVQERYLEKFIKEML